MNTIHRNKLIVALGAALFAGSALNTQIARADDFQAYAADTRNRVRAELTAQPDTGERLQEMRRALDGAMVITGLDEIPAQGNRAIAEIRAETLASFRHEAPAAVGATLAQAQVRPMQVADAGRSERPDRSEWSLPEVEIKPLINMNFLLFSFKR